MIVDVSESSFSGMVFTVGRLMREIVRRKVISESGFGDSSMILDIREGLEIGR